tara:strand:+ start:3959 stop:4183 length:225 start_codon:yes stop_codon:yes gene_type:complete
MIMSSTKCLSNATLKVAQTKTPVTKEKIIYTDKDRISCTGESNDHPLVFYSVPDKGFVVCGYCDLKFAKRREDK